MEKEETVLEITEEVKIPGTQIILEKGDKVVVERYIDPEELSMTMDYAVEALMEAIERHSNTKLLDWTDTYSRSAVAMIEKIEKMADFFEKFSK